MKRFNDWIAIKLTKGVATMWCAYAFAILAILGFPYGSSSIRDYISWVSQTFIQLTMLSVIMVGQELQSKESKKRHKQHMTHIKKIHKHLGVKDES